VTDERERPPILPGEFVTAARVIEITGCTQKELVTYRRTGVIRACGHNSKGWALYNEDSIREIWDRRRREGKPIPDPDLNYTAEQSLAVFKLMKEGLSLADILIETGLHPRALRGVVREYELMSNTIIVMKETLDRMNELSLNGTFPLKNGEMIYDVMKIASQDQKCRSCKRRPRSERCSGCERQRVLRNVSVRGAPNSGLKKGKRSPPADEPPILPQGE
jgi:hypothetical protein